MTHRNFSVVLRDIGYWLRSHWFLCLLVIGFVLVWKVSGIGIRKELTGDIYPSLLLLIPILIAMGLTFLIVIYEDMAT
ncbi:MAG: hypothetical protein ACE5R6_01670 [Candidatus Heimdallarchaeota archaeon]